MNEKNKDNINETLDILIKSNSSIIEMLEKNNNHIEKLEKISKNSNTKSLIIGILSGVIILMCIIFCVNNSSDLKNYTNSVNTMYQTTVKAFENQQVIVTTTADASGNKSNNTNTNQNNNNNNK